MTRVQDNDVNVNNEHVITLYSEPQPEELDNKPKKDSGFLFKKLMPSIFQTKEYVLEDESDYSPWVVNRALSFRMDCIPFANYLNQNGFLPKDMQYNFLLNAVPPKKRFSKWIKKDSIPYLDFVMKHFQVNERKAKEILEILKPEDIEELNEKYSKMEDVPAF